MKFENNPPPSRGWESVVVGAKNGLLRIIGLRWITVGPKMARRRFADLTCSGVDYPELEEYCTGSFGTRVDTMVRLNKTSCGCIKAASRKKNRVGGRSGRGYQHSRAVVAQARLQDTILAGWKAAQTPAWAGWLGYGNGPTAI